MKASTPNSPDGRTYHLWTREGDLAAHCLLVGSPERAEMIATTMFKNAKCVGDHRGLKSFTGEVDGVSMSVVTTGMGSGSVSCVLPEAAYSGARRFIRVGSCSTLWEQARPGDTGIITGAVRLEGASENWAPLAFPALADFRVTSALVDAATESGHTHHVGIAATTNCFYEGQARPGVDSGYVPPRLQAMHDELVARSVLLYEMEAATIFVWCSTHYDGLWAGAVAAIYGNRITNELEVKGDEDAARIAIRAFILLNERFPL